MMFASRSSKWKRGRDEMRSGIVIEEEVER
jgi:hypothetical protein